MVKSLLAQKKFWLGLAALAVTLTVASAHWLNQERSISHQVEIEKPVTTVWQYVSDSSRANEWSIYFSHISPLPSPVPDGAIGSKRRCFRRADETGMYWDETVTAVTPYAYRQLKTYNTNGYGIFDAAINNAVYKVEQIYTPLDHQRTLLNFKVEGTNFWGRAVVNLSYNETLSVFERNLSNIKAYLERGIVLASPYDPHML